LIDIQMKKLVLSSIVNLIEYLMKEYYEILSQTRNTLSIFLKYKFLTDHRLTIASGSQVIYHLREIKLVLTLISQHL